MGPETPYETIVEKGIPISIPNDPDGVKLYADVYRPLPEGRFPTLIYATAYRRDLFSIVAPPGLAKDGYAVIYLDVLGSGSSEGGWEALSDREIRGIAWIIDHWIPVQPWSNGKVGMYGPSYMAVTSLLTAGRKPRHLQAILPAMGMADAYRDVFFQGGILDQEFMFFWARFTVDMSLLLPTQLLFPRTGHRREDIESGLKALEQHRAHEPVVMSWVENTLDGPFYDERSLMSYWDGLAGTPILATGGWWGIFTRGTLLNHTEIVKHARALERNGVWAGPKRIIVGPWYHINGAFMEGLPSEMLHKRWFDWHLKADDLAAYRNFDILDPASPVILYVLGREQWRRETEWPLARARHRALYLSGRTQEHDRNPTLNNGSLIWEEDLWPAGSPSSTQGMTRLTYEPCVESPRFAGEKSRSTCRWLAGAGCTPFSEDERENERLTLTFSTAPLEQDVEVTGPAVLRFYARSHLGIPCATPPAVWYRQGAINHIDLTPLLSWARQPDVHWTVNLNDVYPDGRVRNITSGWLAASHRPDPDRPDWTQEGYDPLFYPEDSAPTPPESGEEYEYVVEIWPAANVFQAGHQIRIDISASDFPHFLPSLVPSENEILHDQAHPSRLILPVVPAESTDPRQWIDDPEAFFEGREDTWTTY
jgi:putative CocE/NonD family hydrolase